MKYNSVAVIGAGWAGCAAAVDLVRKGFSVTIFDSAKKPGGRAKTINYDGKLLDNGQHILLGAYEETFKFMKLVGINPSLVLKRLPLQLRYPKNSIGIDLKFSKVPAPLNLIFTLFKIKGLERKDKLLLAKFMLFYKTIKIYPSHDFTVLELLKKLQQNKKLIDLIWRPICISSMNTPPEIASAKVFLNIIKKSIGSHSDSSDMLIPKKDLSSIFPEAAINYLLQNEGVVKLGVTIKDVNKVDDSWCLNSKEKKFIFKDIIISTSPSSAKKILSKISINLSKKINFDYESITTCYFQYPKDTRLNLPFYPLLTEPSKNFWGQFIFDKGHLNDIYNGLFSVVISSSSFLEKFNKEFILKNIQEQISVAFNNNKLMSPTWSKVFTEKKATFLTTPNLKRPETFTGFQGLYVAGDYTYEDYPATLEGAIKSGINASNCILKDKINY